MNKTLVIGDLHGDVELYKKAKLQFDSHDIILLGDYLDSFKYTRRQQLELIELILKDIKTLGEKRSIQALKGNHELSYLMPERMRCSGYASSFGAHLIPLFGDMHRLLKPYILIPDFKMLLTHAGLSKRLLPVESNCLTDINLLTMWLDQQIRDIDYGFVYNIGIARGGVDEIGGIFWCDWQWDFTPIEGITQVFGHTPGVSIRQKSNNWNVDCLQAKHEFLEIGIDGSIKIIEMEALVGEVDRREI
jgi:predicted phosphodiesterase